MKYLVILLYPAFYLGATVAFLDKDFWWLAWPMVLASAWIIGSITYYSWKQS
jgi:hypothetical protein